MRKRRLGTKKKPTPAAPVSRSQQRALVVIDEGPIREAALSTYQKLETQMGQARLELEAFETGDQPAYQRWEARVFGTLLTDLRNASAELDQKNFMLRAIDEEILWTGCTEVTAYRRIMEALDDPEPLDEEPDFEPADDFGPEEFEGVPKGGKLFGESDLPPGYTAADVDRMPPKEKREFRAFYEQMADLFEMLTGRRAPNLDEVLRHQRAGHRSEAGAGASAPGGRHHRPEPARAVPPEVQRTADRLKELYRALVRQLHPDCHPHQTGRDRELWHQLQTAYRQHDLELMEAIAGRVELGLNGTATSLPVQILLRLTRDLVEALRGLRKQLAAAKQNPAWKFGKRAAELPQLEAKRRKSLERELRKVTLELAEARRILEDLAARAARGKQRRAKRKPKAARQQEFFSF
jgi:hypothetical protein